MANTLANTFDMFKKMQKLIVPDYSDYTELAVSQQFICPGDGFLFGRVTANSGFALLNIAVNGVVAIYLQANDFSIGHTFIPVAKNDKILFTVSNAQNHLLWFYAAREV